MTGRERTVLCLSLSNIATDPRVLRQIEALRPEFAVTAAGLGADRVTNPSSVFVPRHASSLPRKLLQGSLLLGRAYRIELMQKPHVKQLLAELSERQFDLVLTNDVLSLPLAFQIAAGAPVVLDAHEYAPRQGEQRATWRLLQRRRADRWCAHYLPRLAGMMTVGEGLAAEYAREYGVRPRVVRNAPAFVAQSPSPVDEARIRMIHHGVPLPARRPELMVELMGLLDERFSLDLMFVDSNPEYLQRLRSVAATESRIRFVPPVPTAEISRAINPYDIGLFLLPPTNFNYANALPNKFFEFVQGRLGIAVGPTPEMASLTREFGLGVVSDDFTAAALATRLNRLDAADIRTFKAASAAAAAQLNAEHEATAIRGLVADALELGRGPR